jgi:peptide-methionine (S)-S-oxide reductase
MTAIKIDPANFPDPDTHLPEPDSGRAALAGGCFWCTEAVYGRLRGVESVTPGYAGGSPKDANYRAVCTGTTGHAEVIEVRFDPAVISYGQLLKVFFSVAHDPTQVDRQGADIGSQYRSAIFYADDRERDYAAAYIGQLNEAKVFNEPIATRLEPLVTFYPAEEYHHNYAENNPNQPYICAVSDPKVKKLKEAFPNLLANRS